RLEPGAVPGVHLVAVTVTLVHHRLAVGPGHLGAGLEPGDVGAQPHRAAHVHDLTLLVHEVDDQVGRGAVELAGVGSGQAGHVPGQLDHHDLEAETEAEAGDVVLARVTG